MKLLTLKDILDSTLPTTPTVVILGNDWYLDDKIHSAISTYSIYQEYLDWFVYILKVKNNVLEIWLMPYYERNNYIDDE